MRHAPNLASEIHKHECKLGAFQKKCFNPRMCVDVISVSRKRHFASTNLFIGNSIA